MNRFAVLDVEEPVSKRQKALEAKKAEAAPAPTPAPKETPKEAPKKAPQDAPKKAPQDAPKKTQDEKPKAPRGEGKPSDKPREPREPREPRQPREPREPREPRDSNDKPREPRQPREPREPREPRDSTDKPRGVREFKERSDRPFRPRPPRDGEAPVAEGSDAPAPAHFEHRRGGSGRGRGRGDGTRREFDRRGPRVEGGEKKHGFGKGNWGAPGEEEKPAGDAPAQEQAAPSEETAAPAEEAKVEEAPSAPEPEEEDKTMTLEEFKKSRATVKAELPPPRKANEGFEDPKWKNTQVFQREDEVYAKGKEIKETAAPKRKDTKQVERIEIAPTPLIEDRADRSSRRGGRGGSRGGRGGSSRSDRPRTAAPPSLDDAKAFPSLKA